MRLKYQLLLLGLLSLLLPITGWFALKSVDIEFRKSIEQASKNTLTSLEASIQQILKSNPDFKIDGLVLGNINNITIDGYDSEWSNIDAYKYKNGQHHLNVKIAKSNNDLVLFFTSNDNHISINPTDVFANDYVLVGLVDDFGLHQYKYYRQAEGIVKPEHIGTGSLENHAYWHETANGYTLEILFENDNSHHLGFANVNYIDKDAFINKTIAGTLENDTQKSLKLLPIVSNNKELANIVSNITPENVQFTIKDKDHRIIHQSDKLPKHQKISAWQWLITPVYQWLFAIDKTDSKWFYRQDDGMAGIKYSITKNEITYELKSMLPEGQQNMIQTFLKASIMMVGVVILLMLAYLGYALILAWRIKKLNKALQSVLDDSGKLHIQMPSYKAGDEIGQLSRGVQTMLTEMREYTQYLKDLGSRLSHEIKTPLAIIQTSLDNLELEQPKQQSEFLQRARIGSNRLKFILNQLSEVSQLKYTLENTPYERYDLTELCQQLGESYQSFIPQLKLDILTQATIVEGSSDLMAQLIDKIIDNAQDFTPIDGLIELKLISDKKHVILSITNSGSQLPNQGMKIFDSLVSLRKSNNKNTHLGLGLYLVQLIGRFHKTKVTAKNLKKPDRVAFSLKIKLL